MPAKFAAESHRALCQHCKNERLNFRQNNHLPSPACVELFRRALASETQQAIWPCLDEIFAPLLMNWARGNHPFQLEDIVQETWLRFLRSTNNTFQLQDDNRLEMILDYIHTTLKHIVVEWLRKERPQSIVSQPLDETVQNAIDAIEQTQLRVDLERTIGEFLAQENFTDDDRLLFRLKYLLHLKPREIQAEFPEVAEDYDQLEVALQRISRRVKNYADFHNLQPSRRKTDHRALLQVEADQDAARVAGKEVNVDEPCRHEESVLLDYIMGMVEAEVAAAIAAVLAIGLLVSFSRGAWISAALSVAIVVVIGATRARRSSDSNRFAAFATVGTLGFIAVMLGALQIDKVETLLAERASMEQSYDIGPEGRFGGQRKAVALILENPLGIGTHSFRDRHHPEEPHNVYLSMFLNAGWIGGLFYILSVGVTLAVGLHHSLRLGALQGAFVVATAGFAGVAFEGIIIDTDHWRHVFIFMALIWGLSDARRPLIDAARRRTD